jgi:hypothetical protein
MPEPSVDILLDTLGPSNLWHVEVWGFTDNFVVKLARFNHNAESTAQSVVS